MNQNVRPLIILGYSSHHAELAEIVHRVNERQPTWEIVGFSVTKDTIEKKNIPDTFVGYPVIELEKVLSEYSGADFLPFRRAHPSIPMERVISLIDPSAFVSNTAKIGRGCVVYPHCFVGHKVEMGDFVVSLAGVTINHDCVIEDGVFLASGTQLAGTVTVGSRSFMGQGCTVRQLMNIGQNVKVGAGAVVVKDVPSDTVVVGNPARVLDKK